MNDHNEPPKRHVRMRTGRARKEEAVFNMAKEITQADAIRDSYAKEQVSPPIHVTTESTVPKLNSVLQVTKGPHRGRLCQVGRIDLDKFRCFAVLADNGRDFFDVRPGEYVLVAQPKKGMTGLEHPLDLDPQPPTTATQQPAEESPFRNL